MGVSIANLNVMLTANTSRFSASMKASRNDVEAFNRSMEQGQRSMRAFYETQNRATSRSFFDQRVRDEQAARIKAMRAAALNDKVAAEVNQRLFGGMPAVAKAGADAGKIAGKGFIDELKGMFGEESKWGKVFKMFAGTGAVAGLNMAANQFNELTVKAEAFALALHRADGSAGEMAAELLKSIPIVGKLGEGLARVWSILSGEAAAIEAINKSTANTNAVTDAMKARMQAVGQFAKESTERIEDMDRAFARLSLHGQSLKLFEVDAAAMDRAKKLTEDARQAGNTRELEESRKRLADLRKQQINTPTMVTEWEYTDYGNGEVGKDLVTRANPKYRKIVEDIAALEKQLALSESQISEQMGREGAKSERLRWAEKINITMQSGMAWVAANAEAANKVAEDWIEATSKASKSRTDFIADLQREWEQLDWTENERKLDEFRRKFSPSPEELEKAKELLDSLDMAAEQKKFLDSLDSDEKDAPERDSTKERLATIERRFTANLPREAFQKDAKMLKAAEKTAKASQEMNSKMSTVVHNLDFEVIQF